MKINSRQKQEIKLRTQKEFNFQNSTIKKKGEHLKIVSEILKFVIFRRH